MKTIDIVVEPFLYDDIAMGKVTEAYRAIHRPAENEPINPQEWLTKKLGGPICFAAHPIERIRFFRGLTLRNTMLVEITSTHIGYGKKELGAPENEEIIIYKLGRIISNTFDCWTSTQNTGFVPHKI